MGCACFKDSVTDSPEYIVQKYSSTRMKKVAPPPPPPPVEKAPPPPLSNGSVKRSVSADRQRPLHPTVSSTPGEDCAIDELLEGRMDLEVVLPDCKMVRMTVDRKTPMMDLLVQATTSNKISPSDHTINLISRDERNIQYKPNTPIGSLDANTVYIIPKSTLELPVKRMPKLANQPFEQQTFRLQVNLPHHQRMVLRVSPRITLDELKQQICSEKELDFSSHHLVHPAHPDTVLDLNATLDVYGCAEISLMSNSGLRDSIRSSTLYAYPPLRPEEEKKKRGILRLFSRKKRDFVPETASNGINHLTSSQSDGATLNRNNSSSYQPKQSLKRKPAPAPPPARNVSPPLITQSSNSINSRPESEISAKTADEIESSVSHSRHSSDSSGYHEPSVFSDCSENKSPEASILHGDHGCVTTDAHRQDSPLQQKETIDCSSVQMKRSSMTARDSNLKNVPSCSNVSIISASRKRKAPQPPVSTLPAIESPTSPEAPPIDSVAVSAAAEAEEAESTTKQEDSTMDNNTSPTNASQFVDENDHQTARNVDSKQQESEALQFLEDVLQESEKLHSPSKMLDDSDTDSLKDEGEVISVCQAEVHANASDHESPDSVVESQTVVAPVPDKFSFATPLSNPNSQSAGCEVVDTSADDSGISQSLNSDADSSVPSLNSDYKTMSDSGCQEDIYCNVTESAIPKLVPSDIELSAQSNSAESVNTKNYESSVCEGAVLELSDTNSCNSGGKVQLPEDRCSSPADAVRDRRISDSELSQKHLPSLSRTESTVSEQESKDTNPVKNSSDKSCSSSVSGGSHQNSTTVTPQCRRKLDNFVLSSYKKDDIEDIYSAPSDSVKQSSENSCLVNNSDDKSETEVPKRKLKSQPEVRIVSLKEKTEVDAFDADTSKGGRVQEKCARLNKISTLPLAGRCSSMYNLTPQQKVEKPPMEEVMLEDGMKRTQSDQNFSNDLKPVDLKECFLLEQRRLQEEYQRLQEQFISWQTQLMNNQSLLQSENILPQMPFTSLVGLEKLETSTKKTVSENQLTSRGERAPFDQYKTRSLPRPKTKSLSLKEPSRPKTPPVPQSPTKEASVVDIDIGSEDAPKRPETLASCSVDTQASVNSEDKKTQIPSPQDKVVQVPSPQDKVTSGVQVPSPETVKSKEDVSAQTSIQNLASPTDSTSSESEGSKSQTLPRPKPRPLSAFQPSETMTLNRKFTPKVVSVTIGSWQQRQAAVTNIEPANVASTRSKFQSLESIPRVVNKQMPSFMEKRKLPPVPTEETTPKEVTSAKDKTLEHSKENKSSKIIRESSKPSGKSFEKTSDPDQIVSDPDETAVKAVLSVSKAPNTAASRLDEKQKVDIKLSSKESNAMFKSAKPFIKMSSMKDESHPPSIIGLRKWPLSGANENKSMGEGKQSILDDLKASSKRPGGFVQETIRRAEVDLRKPKSTKAESTSTTKVKEANVEPTKPKSLNTESTSATKVKEAHAEPSKLHITKVSINNVKGNEDSKQSAVKKTYSSKVTTPVTAPSNPNWGNTIPKSQSLNSELLAAFSKKASKDTDRYKEVGGGKTTTSAVQSITVNGSVQPPTPPPPPPPPPVQSSSSAMPTIPPAEQIPVSSQLLRETTSRPHKKESKKSPTKFSRTADPREELMLEIRGFGGKRALRKLYEKSCLKVLKKSPKKKAIPEEPGSSSELK